jgi:hypothetical protein
MYDDLIYKLQELVCDRIKDTDDARLVCDAINAINALTKPRWIPVAKRPPERGENVLVANKRGKQWDIDKAWLSCYGSGFDRCGKRPLYHVTHWMPLPEPPKEG